MTHFPISAFAPLSGEMEALLRRFAAIESPSGHIPGLEQLAGEAAAELGALGAQISVHRQPGAASNLAARFNPAGAQKPLLLLAHMDTVHPTGSLERMPLRVENGRLYGPGVYDMKGGIVLLIFALRMLRQAGRLTMPLVALLTCDEETGSHTSRGLIEEHARQSRAVLCLEPASGDGKLKTARKGTGQIELETHGQAAHAGVDHAKGRNAIEELAHHILAAGRLTDYNTGTTVSVGRVEGGGPTNVVPDFARAVADLRIAEPQEVQRIENWVAARRPVIDGCRVSARLDLNRPPMPRTPAIAGAFARAQSAARRLGFEVGETSTGGASDANFAAPFGLPLLDGLGPCGDGSHSTSEFTLLASLPERAALLAELLQEDW